MTRDEDDTGWVRDALGSLDRPAIPDQVAHRIDAALAAAPLPQQRRPPGTVPEPAQAAPGGPRVVRRRSWLVGAGGLAAAVVAVALIGPANGPVVPSTPTDAQVAAPATSPTAAGAAPDASAGTGAVSPEASPLERSVAAVLMASQTTYSEDALADQVADVTELQASEQVPPTGLPQPWTGAATQPAATARGAAACVAALPVPGGELLYVDRAVYEGRPVLVVARSLDARIEVFVLGAGCTAADTRILARATVGAGE